MTETRIIPTTGYAFEVVESPAWIAQRLGAQRAYIELTKPNGQTIYVAAAHIVTIAECEA